MTSSHDDSKELSIKITTQDRVPFISRHYIKIMHIFQKCIPLHWGSCSLQKICYVFYVPTIALQYLPTASLRQSNPGRWQMKEKLSYLAPLHHTLTKLSGTVDPPARNYQCISDYIMLSMRKSHCTCFKQSIKKTIRC
jgi:hypothetical protein